VSIEKNEKISQNFGINKFSSEKKISASNGAVANKRLKRMK
jgi:hypothetical protein